MYTVDSYKTYLFTVMKECNLQLFCIISVKKIMQTTMYEQNEQWITMHNEELFTFSQVT